MLGTAHGSARLAEREEGAEAFPWAQLWFVATLGQPEPRSRAGKTCYCSLVTKRAREIDALRPRFFRRQIAP